jgi:hypothetical protein
VEECYKHLSGKCAGGKLTVKLLERTCVASALPCSHTLDSDDPADALQEFLTQWGAGNLGAEGVVTWANFLDYYFDASACIESDKEFGEFVGKLWGLHVGDLVAKKIFREFADDGNLNNPVSMESFYRMLSAIDPQMSDQEAAAWFHNEEADNYREIKT